MSFSPCGYARASVLLGILLHLITGTMISAQPRGADAVVLVTPGIGAGYGFDFLPDNVLGLPDSTARRTVPTVDPKEIAGIGLGGEITLSFDHEIVDGPGPDFTVFENAFYYMLGPFERIYVEPAEVSVSRDGTLFVPFPFDSLTLVGCAGTQPTQGDRDPGDPSVSGGNSFDLGAIPVDSVRYIRLRDVTPIVVSNASHPFRDPTLNGFDLDAVVAIHSAFGLPGAVSIDRRRRSASIVANDCIIIEGDAIAPIDVRLYSIDGTELWRCLFDSGKHTIPLSSLISGHGPYLLATIIAGQATTIRIVR